MFEKKEEKLTTIELDKTQFKSLITSIVCIADELKIMTNKIEKLENAILKLEGELKLIRIEMKEIE